MMSLPSLNTNPPSPASTADSSDAPRTPGDDQGNSNIPTNNNNNGAKGRKASRRANTAERRATHNAVERQRRETLNGRFLDLAALLPNLSQIRRPSKSSIVNSSIAHVQGSRRHRMLASKELRSMKMESDALRRELNEWRLRAGIPRIEEPVRGEAFSIVLSGELDVLLPAPMADEDYEDGDYDDGPAPAPAPVPNNVPAAYQEAPYHFAPTHAVASPTFNIDNPFYPVNYNNNHGNVGMMQEDNGKWAAYQQQQQQQRRASGGEWSMGYSAF